MAHAEDHRLTRRHVLQGTSLSAGILLASGRFALAEENAESQETEISPGEDLMREHAVLDRLLLIYEHVIATSGMSPATMTETLTGVAQLIRSFIEEYHEALEENYVFPAFSRAGKQIMLVSVLRAQHRAGRQLTDAIESQAKELTDSSPRERLNSDIRSFIRMYRPHAAREGTVLFPEMHSVIEPGEYEEMGERFEEIEREKFGASGFNSIVEQVAEIEKKLDIYDLSRFTP